MKLLGFLSKIIPEGIVKDVLRIPTYWLVHALRFVKYEHNFGNGSKGIFFKYPFEKIKMQEDVMEYLKYNGIEKNQTVIDAGAFEGQFTVLASKLVGKKGKVIVIEPDPFNILELKKTIKANKLENVIILNKGLSDTESTLSWKIGGIESQIGESSIFHIKTTTLDSIFKKLKLRQVDFIKMDIEGAEIVALKNSKILLKKTQNVAIASYHIVDGRKTCYEVEKILSRNGFSVKTEKNGQLITFGSKK